MRKALLLFCISIFSYQGYSQEYLPMWETDHVWSTRFESCPDPCVTTYDEYQIVGETTINGMVYQDLSTGFGSFYVREENGRVYQYFSSENDEFLMLDFSMDVGEIYTFPPPYAGGLWDDMEVVAVSTQMIAGEMRKVIEFEDTFGSGIAIETWIEGVGSDHALLSGGNLGIDDGTDLVCFTKNGMTYFFNGANQCTDIIGIDDVPLKLAILYPNPVVNTSLLQFSSEGLVDLVKIFDVTGRLVKEENVTKDYVLIDAMKYRSGLYFCQVFSENILLKTEKFIIK